MTVVLCLTFPLNVLASSFKDIGIAEPDYADVCIAVRRALTKLPDRVQHDELPSALSGGDFSLPHWTETSFAAHPDITYSLASSLRENSDRSRIPFIMQSMRKDERLKRSHLYVTEIPFDKYPDKYTVYSYVTPFQHMGSIARSPKLSGGRGDYWQNVVVYKGADGAQRLWPVGSDEYFSLEFFLFRGHGYLFSPEFSMIVNATMSFDKSEPSTLPICLLARGTKYGGLK